MSDQLFNTDVTNYIWSNFSPAQTAQADFKQEEYCPEPDRFRPVAHDVIPKGYHHIISLPASIIPG